MRFFKEMKWDSIFRACLYICLGLVALLIPETMERTLGYLVGVVLIIAGAVSMIEYLIRDPYQNYYHNDFVYGLAIIAIGIVVLYKVEMVVSMIPFILGLMVLVSGCVKLQDSIDSKRLGYGNYLALLILAILNLILGIVLMVNPFKAATILFKVLGAGLLISGVTDILITVYFASKMVKYIREKEKEVVDAEKVVEEKVEEGQNKEEEKAHKINWDEK